MSEENHHKAKNRRKNALNGLIYNIKIGNRIKQKNADNGAAATVADAAPPQYGVRKLPTTCDQ